MRNLNSKFSTLEVNEVIDKKKSKHENKCTLFQ